MWVTATRHVCVTASVFDVCRLWNKHSTPNTDTDDTDDNCSSGGLGFYSHGNMCLPHQHWVMQVKSAGGFNVNNTQSSESAHKHNMHLASTRVRHLEANKTQSEMSRYLRNNHLFREMNKIVNSNPQTGTPRVYSVSIRGNPLWELNEYGDRVPTTMRVQPDLPFSDPRFQKQFLHREVRLARVEIMDLLCAQLGMPSTRESYTRFEDMDFHFGHSLRYMDGSQLWGTDSEYKSYSTNDGYARRRDVVLMNGVENRSYTQNGSTVERRDALCGEIVCFMSTRWHHGGDTRIWLIVRWFEPHNTHERDSKHRPVCPGPLRINHCLWRYARLVHPRKTMVSPRTGQPCNAYRVQSHFFGSTAEQQQSRFRSEKRAFYGLVEAITVANRVNMCPIFLQDTHEPDTSVWLETVTLI